MIPAFVKRLSSRLSLTRKPSEKSDETDGRPSMLSRRSTKDRDKEADKGEKSLSKKQSSLDKITLSKRPTLQLNKESSTSRSSRQVTFQKSVSRKSSSSSSDKAPVAPSKSLSKKLSSAQKSSSLVSKPILAGRAPSLTARKSKDSVPSAVGTPKKSKPNEKTLWFLRGVYVTVRNEEGGWYLCRLQQNVYNTSKSVKIRWLSRKRGRKGGSVFGPNDYELDYRDEIDPACILFSVRVTREKSTFKLYEEDRLETDKLLKVAADVESGKLTADDVDSDVEEVVQIEPPTKKRKTEKTEKGKKAKTDKKKTTKGSGSKAKVPKEKKKKTESKEPKRKVAKKKDEITLHPNPDIKIQKKDPFFESNQSVPFVSKYAHSRLIFRAVVMKDYKLMKKLFKETERVRDLCHWRSVADRQTALHHAIKLNDKQAMKMLVRDFFNTDKAGMLEKRKKNSQADKVNVAKLDTGSYNFRSLGVAYIRPIMASRGSREGNNALTKDLSDMRELEGTSLRTHVTLMLRTGMDYKDFKEILALDSGDTGEMDYSYYQLTLRSIDEALERGHHKLVGQFMQDINEKHPRMGRMSNLHYTVLISDKELKNAPPSQVHWGLKSVSMITPVHCAACNPDTQYLERLLKVEPDIHISDKLNRRPIHFAAACSSTAPLELLVKRGANIYDCDRQGRTPLMWAVQADRIKNVQLLLESGSKRKSGEEEDPMAARYGIGGINRPKKDSSTPLHIATENGNLDMIRFLLKNGAKINAKLNTSRFKVTPLMIGAQHGLYDVVVFFIDNGAVVQEKDRLGRTAVIHAAMNGNTNVLSYLLNIGANPNLCDNSGNSPLHYAAAYGWYFCVKTLLEAGANVNVGNDWKTTPLSIAYMKAHTGIVHQLLQDSDVDVDFQDDEGLTLVSTAASSALYAELYDQMHYLIKDKGASCTYKDVEEGTPLHHLAANDILLEGTSLTPLPSDEAMNTSVKIAKLLVEGGCDVKAVNKKGMTAAMVALRSGNLKLFKYLVECGCQVKTELIEGDNILHHLCYDHMDSMKDYLAILKYAAKTDGKSGTQNLKKAFRDMSKVYCHDGSTPLLAACQQYSVCKKSHQGLNDDKDACRLLWKRGRDYIKFLIDEFGSDVNGVIRERYYEKEEDKPKKEEDRYQDDWGKWSVAEMLADVEHCEYAGLREKTEEEWPALRMILKYKPNMNTRDNEGHTALTGAVDYSKIIPAQLLVKESNADINAYYIKEEDGKKHKIWTVVIAALTANQTLLDLIVEAGADLNVVDERDGAKPLHAAIIKGDKADGTMKMMRTLLDHGAAVDVLNKKLRTPLHLAVDYNAGNMNDNFDLVLALINKGAKLTIQDIRGRTPMHYVFVKTGKHTDNNQSDPVELCRIIASRMKPSELNIQDNFGMTALHRAAFRGANICCMYLLQKGADVNIKDKNGNTPLTMAMMGMHDGCATVLIQNGACLKDIMVVEVTEETSTSGDASDASDDDVDMDAEEEKKKKKKAKKLKPVWNWEPLKKEEKVETIKKIPLFEHAIDHQFQGVCFLMMDKPVKESGITFADAIEIGLKLKKYNIVLRLLTTTADVSSLKKDRDNGQNLLHKLSLTATTHNSLIEKVVTQLVEKGVSLTKQDNYRCTPLLYASLKKNYELCKFYLKTPGVYNPKYTDSFNRSVLASAFWNASKAFDSDMSLWVDELLEKKGNMDELIDRPIPECLFGATDNISDPDYWKSYVTVKISPLIICILYHNQFFTQWLLKKGANPNFTDNLGKTPMMHAVAANDINLVKTLMNFEFDPKAKDEEEAKKKEDEQSKKKMQSRIFRLKRSASKLSQLSKDDDSSSESEDEEEQEKKKEEEKEKEKKEYKPFKKTSKVDLNAVDKNGWTVIHHAACPLSFGTFDNDEIVFILAKAGAKLNVKNKKGESALDLAVKNGAFKIARMIQELENISQKNRREPKYFTISVDDNLKWKTPQPSFHEDAERLITKLGKPMEVEEEYEAKIDPQCDVKNGTLVKDEEQDLLYDVLLTKVDVNCGEWGLYNFYQIQLVHQPGKDLYILFTRWGRIGDSGQFQHTPYQVKEEGIKEFCKIFRAKTGNKWTEVKSFENKPRKYRIVKDKERRKGHTQTDIEFESKSTVKSKLPEHLQEVMEEMTNMKSLKAALQKEKMDSDIMPFGRMQRDRLLKAREVLQKISAIVSEVEEYRRRKKGTEEEEAKLKENYQKNCEQIAALSSEYFQVIPQKGFSFEKIRPLDSMNLLKKEIGLVSNLLDYEVASRMLLGAKHREKEMNMLDYVYQSVGCKIQLLAEGDQESQYILRYIASSSPATKVEAIYRLEVPGEQARMDKKNLKDHRLLFHGSGVANFLSILNRGLVIAPPDAPTTGHLFGKGIYFSDTFTKSAGYSSNLNSDSSTLFMLLCEVALGKSKEIYSGYLDRPEKGFDSVFVVGRNRPNQDHSVTLATGCLMPFGETQYNYQYKDQYVSNYYNEYIVYDEGQVCLRYLIQYRTR